MRRIMKPESKPSDTQSVISDAGTSISGCGSSFSDNREDLQEFAFRLGLPSADHLTRDRFRVDRRKLEGMILGGVDNVEPADVFFQNVMDSTETRIMWPVKLKIGAKSKKDPCIRIAGRAEDVAEAKKKILAILETRPWVINFSSGYKGYRVTMKLDVSYTDHSHIIGKGGQTIKSVMEKTGCHIHFPDSNRINQTEKSNQISIAGDMAGVEKARARVRELTPLIFSFELPLLGGIQPCPEQNCEEIKEVEGLYNVQVMFRTRPKLHSTLVVVKGCEWELASVKEATLVLMNKLCDSLANQMPVHMSMEISPIHHPIVLGKMNTNLKTIMHHTGVQVMFPDANDPNIPSLKKSSVTITGGIHNVYLARQMLLGSLPMVIMFDINGESAMITNEQVTDLMNALDVVITIRYKPKQSITSVSIRGVERNANNVYEARRLILKLNDSPVKAVVPENYNVPSAVPSYLFNAGLTTSSGVNVNSFFDGRFKNNNNYSSINNNMLSGNNRKIMLNAFSSQLQSSMWPLLPTITSQLLSHSQKIQQQEQQATMLQNQQDSLSHSSLSLPDIKDCQGVNSQLKEQKLPLTASKNVQILTEKTKSCLNHGNTYNKSRDVGDIERFLLEKVEERSAENGRSLTSIKQEVEDTNQPTDGNANQLPVDAKVVSVVKLENIELYSPEKENERKIGRLAEIETRAGRGKKRNLENNEIVQDHKKIKCDNEDEDKLFLLSLVSEMRKVSPYDKLKLRSDMMALIFQAQKKPQFTGYVTSSYRAHSDQHSVINSSYRAHPDQQSVINSSYRAHPDQQSIINSSYPEAQHHYYHSADQYL